MARLGFALAAASIAAFAPASVSAAGGCPATLAPAATPAERPLSITIESGLQVGRLGLTGHDDGDAAIDPQTGNKQVGRNMIDLGGLSFQGKATITGQPMKPVRIELPQTVMLHSPSGAEAVLTNFRTDLPPLAMLDAHGQLQFNFGATISSRDSEGGAFRGRIAISVEYY